VGELGSCSHELVTQRTGSYSGWSRCERQECTRNPQVRRRLSPPSPLYSGLNGVPGSIWDFVSGSFSPSPSPILNTGPTGSSSASPNGAELARVRRQLDEARRKIRQWEESWQQVKQVREWGGAWPRR
jgi:hypothetical protein